MRTARLARAAGPLVLALAGLVAACGGAGGDNQLAEGRYHYVASHPAPSNAGPMRLEGVLVITESGSDSVSGIWEVPELQPDVDLGNWVDSLGVYEVMANPTYFGVLTHRLRPQGGEVLCEGDYTWVAEGGVQRTVPVACTLTLEDVNRPQMPARGAEDPIIREIDADTVPVRGLSPDATSGPRTDSAGGTR